MSIRAVDLFCGVGGLTAGLRVSGIEVVAGIDLDERCRYAYEVNNLGSQFVHKDVAQVKASEISELFDDAELTLLAGCAPCQPFSTYSRTGQGSKDWPLLAQFGRLVREVIPDFVTMENVPGVAAHQVYLEFVSTLQELEYAVTVIPRVYCPDYGIPQTRTRLVLLASKHGTISAPATTHEPSNYQTVWHAIGEQPIIEAGDRDPDDPLHTSSRLSPLNMERMRASRPGGTWQDWPDELRAKCHFETCGETYKSVYGRMAWRAPAPTITTQCYGFGNGRFGHPTQNRAISLREAALLQTFPSSYKFTPPGQRVEFSTVGRLIGNAVPVRLGEVIGEAIVDHAALLQDV